MKKIFFLMILTGLASCDKYLDIEPKGSVIPRSVEEYDLLLNAIHSTANEEVLALTGDDFKIHTFNSSEAIDVTNPDNEPFQLFSWGDNRFYNPTNSVSAWNTAYKNIYTLNKVINEVISAQPSLGYSEAEKVKIQAEAYYARALEYFFLVNIFSNPYTNSANTDLSVPIVTSADVTQSGLSRATVSQVYEFIINDLEKAVKNLPDKSKAVVRPNIGSGYSLLSRVLLYKGDYEKSLEYAIKSIDIQNVNLQDYVNYDPNTIHTAYRAEQYSMHYFGGTRGYQGALSDDLKSILNITDDARYYKFFTFYPSYGREFKTSITEPNAATSVGEMYVTRAECYARLGKKDLAIADLNTLRAKRIKNHQPIQMADFTTDKDLLKFCFEERRREVLLSHLRLFDIKRMNLMPELAKTLTKEFQGAIYTAEPNSGKLVLPIPVQVLKFNPSWRK